MKKHYILSLNPHAEAEWDRCVLRNPLTGDRPDLTEEIAKALENKAGSYLIKVSLEVEILEQNIPQPLHTFETQVKTQIISQKEKLAC